VRRRYIAKPGQKPSAWLLRIVSALGYLNGIAGFVQLYHYLNGYNCRLSPIFVNITAFAASLIYVSIRHRQHRGIKPNRLLWNRAYKRLIP
jgi:hypothetical protein